MMIFPLVALALLCLLPAPSQAKRKRCVLYTMASSGVMGPFTQEQWDKTNRYFGLTSDEEVIEEGMKCLHFIKEWYGIEVEVRNETLSGKDPSPAPFRTEAENGTFSVSTLNPSADFRLYSELRGKKIRRHYAPVAVNFWGITTDNEFVVTTGKNRGMTVSAGSFIGCRNFAIMLGKKGFDPLVLWRLETRVPLMSLPMPLGRGKYVIFNEYVTCLNNPQFGEGVGRGVLPINEDGSIDGRMVVSFSCP